MTVSVCEELHDFCLIRTDQQTYDCMILIIRHTTCSRGFHHSYCHTAAKGTCRESATLCERAVGGVGDHPRVVDRAPFVHDDLMNHDAHAGRAPAVLRHLNVVTQPVGLPLGIFGFGGSSSGLPI